MASVSSGATVLNRCIQDQGLTYAAHTAGIRTWDFPRPVVKEVNPISSDHTLQLYGRNTQLPTQIPNTEYIGPLVHRTSYRTLLDHHCTVYYCSASKALPRYETAVQSITHFISFHFTFHSCHRGSASIPYQGQHGHPDTNCSAAIFAP